MRDNGKITNIHGDITKIKLSASRSQTSQRVCTTGVVNIGDDGKITNVHSYSERFEIGTSRPSKSNLRDFALGWSIPLPEVLYKLLVGQVCAISEKLQLANYFLTQKRS